MAATADLWVYNAENVCVSFFYKVTSIFHLRGGEIKKKFFWDYLGYMVLIVVLLWLFPLWLWVAGTHQGPSGPSVPMCAQEQSAHCTAICAEAHKMQCTEIGNWMGVQISAQGPSVLIFPQSTCLLPLDHCLSHHLSSLTRTWSLQPRWTRWRCNNFTFQVLVMFYKPCFS